jgi:hypothetical protein
MSFNLCSSFAIIRKAGASANATAVASGALIAEYCDQAEAELFTATGYDWVTNYASINTNAKQYLAKIVAAKAAIEVINYDMGKYTKTLEATKMLDVLYDIAAQGIKTLQDINFRKKIGATD